MRLSSREKEILRTSVQNFLGQQPDASKSTIVNHFLRQGYPRSTIYATIDRVASGLPCQDLPRSGRPRVLSKRQETFLKKAAENKVGVSIRKLSRKYPVHFSTIHRYLKRLNLNYYRRQKVPKYTAKQAEDVRSTVRRLLRRHFKPGVSIIIDDEKYFGFGCDEIPGNAGFYTEDKAATSTDVKFKGQEKYPTKILVWIAVSDRGISEPLFRKSKSSAINQKVYLAECLQARLLPFINRFHADGNYCFWPDKASSHYANAVLDWLFEENINFVPKDDNPTNLPQARPIENLWGVLAQRVYEGGWTAKSERALRMRIKKKLRELGKEPVQAMFQHVRTKLRTVADKGPLATSVL